MIGIWEGSYRPTHGALASEGSRDRTLSTLARTSLARLQVRPPGNRSVTRELPSRDKESMLTTPLTVLTACSMGMVMKLSISSGATPE